MPMNRLTPTLLTGVLLLGLGYLAGTNQSEVHAMQNDGTSDSTFQLGAFSLSLSVKNLEASRKFYAVLGFLPEAGSPEDGWQILRNGDVVIGLFEGKFEGNIMTFNPGWDVNRTTLEQFQDVREIQARIKAAGIELALDTDPNGEGIGHIFMTDPDGNQIMFDQHVPKPPVGGQ